MIQTADWIILRQNIMRKEEQKRTTTTQYSRGNHVQQPDLRQTFPSPLEIPTHEQRKPLVIHKPNNTDHHPTVDTKPTTIVRANTIANENPKHQHLALQRSPGKTFVQHQGKRVRACTTQKYFKKVKPVECLDKPCGIHRVIPTLNFSKSHKSNKPEIAEEQPFTSVYKNSHRMWSREEKSGCVSPTYRVTRPQEKFYDFVLDKENYDEGTDQQPDLIQVKSGEDVPETNEDLPTNSETRQIGGGKMCNSYPTTNPILCFKDQKSSKKKYGLMRKQTLNPCREVLEKTPRRADSGCMLPTDRRITTCKKDFEFGKRLGKGRYGDVYIVRHKLTGFLCAMKVIDKDIVREEEMQEPLTREIKISFFMDHPNIATLYGCFDDQQHVYLLFELCSQGSLYQTLKQQKSLTEIQTVTVIKQLCQGASYLHGESIIHRDVKPENIIIQNGLVKLCDFGWAVYCPDNLRSTFCGTPLYVSPEVLKGEDYNYKIDIWAIGILTYELLVGRVPFRITAEEDLAKIIYEEIVFPPEVEISQLASDFILKILKRAPQERVGINQVIDHPFLKQECPSLFLVP